MTYETNSRLNTEAMTGVRKEASSLFLRRRECMLFASSALDTGSRLVTAALWATLITTSAATPLILANSSQAQAEALRGESGGAANTGSSGGYGNGWGGGATSGYVSTKPVNGVGVAGADSSNGYAGGPGGAVGATAIQGGLTTIVGRAGGQGVGFTVTANARAAGGGGGGAGLYLSGGEEETYSGLTVVGGIGGHSGKIVAPDGGAYGGGGGGGGAGVILDGGRLLNVSGAAVVGGAGGDVYWGNVLGNAGAGGDGIVVQNAYLTNYGMIMGGAGGVLDGVANNSHAGNGGAGLRMGDNSWVINAGTIVAGANKSTIMNPAPAIAIVGNNSTLELRSGSDIQGNVVVSSGMTGNRLVFGGDEDVTFAANELGIKYRGFDQFIKSGDGTWTLTGANTVATPWEIKGGTLAISQAGSLGSSAGSLTIDGGTLATTGTFSFGKETTVFGADGATLDVQSGVLTLNNAVTGAGSLTKVGSGQLIVTDRLDYTGDTVVSSGKMTIGAGGIDGEISGNVSIASGATLEFNHSNIELFDGALSGTGTIQVDSPGGVILAGDNSGFTGAVLANGTTTVNGALGATSVDVSTTGELAGTGSIVGDTTVASGGKLIGTQGSTLAFNQNLTLDTGSVINVGLGLPDSSDGALFSVGGDLTLKGTMNVSSNGGFGAGTYRIFDYTGALLNQATVLTDVSFGTTPSGVTAGDLTLLTSTAQQVSILNTTGMTVNFWDGASAGGGSIDGGNGTWNMANSSWTDTTGNATNQWVGTQFAVFQGAGGTVTIDNTDGQVSATGMQFGVDGYHVTGDALLLETGGDKPVIRVGDGTTAGRNMTATVSSELQGTEGFRKADYGTLILTGENTYTGGTEVQNGTLQIGDGGTAGSVVGDIVVGLDDVNLAKLVYKRSDDVTMDHVISGTGQLEQAGTGTLILTGENTYTGVTNISAGAIQLGNGGASGSLVGDVEMAAGTQLIVNRDNTSELVLGGDILGGGKVVQAGSGTTVLEGTNNYSGGTQIDSGTLAISKDVNLGDPNGGVTIGAGTLEFRGDVDLLATRTIELTDAASTINTGTHTDRIAGVVSGTGGLTKDGSGKLILTGENTYAGGSTVKDGILQIGDGGTGGSITGPVGIDSGAKLAIDLSKDLTVDGVLSGDGGFVQQGSGTTTLTGENTYKGGTEITAGVLVVGSDNNLGDASGGVRIDGGTLQTSSSFDSARAVELGAGNGAIDTQGNTNTLSGIVSGSGQLIKDGSGTLILTGENSYTGGSAVKGGVLQIGNGGTNGSITGNVDLVGPESTLDIKLAKDITLDGVISGSGDLIQSGSGITTLTSTNTYTGETRITDGELRLVGDGSIEHSDRVDLDAVLDVTNANDLNVNIQSINSTENGIIRIGNKTLNLTDAKGDTFAGIIEGDGGHVKLQQGTERLTGENSYTGGTSIDDGARLIIGNGGKKGSVQGEIAVEGTLVYDRSDRYTVNQLSGGGDLNLHGGGTAVINTKQGLTGEVGIDAGNTLALEGDGDISTAEGVNNNGKFDISGSNFEDIRIGYLHGEESGRTELGSKNLVITNGDGGEYAGQISGSGGFTVEKGKQLLSGENTYTGDTQILAGAELQLGNDDRAGSITSNVINDGIVSGSGSMNDLLNRGTVSPGTDTTFGTLTVNGNYSSEGGKLILHEALADDNTKGDRLVVAGNTSGATEVTVVNRGGLGAQTVNGVKVIEVGGQSDGQFNLNGDYVNYRGAQAVVAGAYAYTLEKGGVSNPDGNWYLRSQMKGYKPEPVPEYQAGVPVYGSAASAIGLLNRGGFASFGSRMKSGITGGTSGADSDQDSSKNDDALFRSKFFWGQVTGGYSFYTPNGNATNSTYASHDWRLQTGLDGQLMENASGSLFGTVWLDYTRSQIDVWSNVGKGQAKVNGYGFGGALTWYGENGFYLDGQGKVSWYKSDMESDRLSENAASDVKSFGYALSLEAGQAFALNDRWTLTPQAQLIWSSVGTDEYRDVFSASVVTPDNQTLTGRFGVAADYGTSWVDVDGTTTRLNVGGLANIYQDFKSGSNYIVVSDVRVATGNIEKTWGEIGATANYSWANDAYSVFGKASVASSLQNFGDNYSVTGNVGFRVKW